MHRGNRTGGRDQQAHLDRQGLNIGFLDFQQINAMVVVTAIHAQRVRRRHAIFGHMDRVEL